MLRFGGAIPRSPTFAQKIALLKSLGKVEPSIIEAEPRSFGMLMNRLTKIAVVSTIAVTTASSVASATTYAAPESYPNSSGGYEQAYVTANVNVRSGPGQNNRVVNRLERGDAVNVGECRANWCFVDAFGGNGWVSGRFIGRGENPYNPNRPAGPEIPPQEPGTYDSAPVGRM